MEISKLRSRKFRKPSDRDRENVDRLSELPDDVLIHILSFLPTKIYVATSILGRRWRFLWARVPNLDFNDENADESRFSSIVNRVMFLQKRENINSFRFSHLHEIPCCDDDEFEKWITTAIECNVQELDLLLAWEVRLPKCILTCKTLVNLRLAWLVMPTKINTVCLPAHVHLPALKKLQLAQVSFESVECFHHFLSGCPVLNELFITNDELVAMDECFFVDDFEGLCCISSPTLNRLELQEIKWNHERVFSVKLDTPALKYLKLENYEADFSESGFAEGVWIPRYEFLASPETFNNITNIELVADRCFIPSFLEKANNLEVLTIHTRHDADNRTYWKDPKQVPACLVSHLGTVRIHDFLCSKQEFKAVRYILKNAKVLKRMEIYSKSHGINLKKQHEALKIISLFKRGSEACRLVFH